MPKKPQDKIRVPLNVLIAPVTKESITGLQNDTGESQGEIVDRAVALLAHGEVVELRRGKRETKRERIVRERAQSDVTAQIVGRAGEIDYSDVDSAPTTHVARLDAVGVSGDGGRGKATVETAVPLKQKLADWRAGRKPLLKPKDQK